MKGRSSPIRYKKMGLVDGVYQRSPLDREFEDEAEKTAVLQKR